ncbi:MAG: hypothetical protein PHU85_05085 [Phycisphaerae bacterium]|nr:hypothetical protein [Phycisphaerae bacterium]
MRQLVLVAAVALSLLASAWAETYEAPLDARPVGEAKLAGPVKVAKAADAVTISFAVTAATDVEVAILDAKGRIVRHLAAGLLGKNAPPPLAKDSLAQQLTWDGKDDLGKAPAGGPFSVRVRANSGAKLDKQLGWDGQTLGPIISIVAGAKGELYVLAGSAVGQGRTDLRVFDRDGKYLRTIMPYPDSTPPERAKSVGQLEVDGRRIPIVFNGHGHNLSPLTVAMPRQNMAWNPKGWVVAASSWATPSEHGLPRHLLAFDPRGGAPAGMSFVGPELRPPTGITWGKGEGDDPCFDHLAASPDGKWLYYTPSTFYSEHAVYRLAWGEDHGAGMEAGWFGFANRPGGDDTHLNGPAGLAVDSAGRVYVCDRGNNRVAVVSPEGKLLGSIAVDDPEQIAVHPATGEIYVFCKQAPSGDRPKDTGPISMDEYRAWKARVAERKAKLPAGRPPKLVKFAAWGKDAPKQLAKLDIDLGVMTLDGEAKPPRLWTATGYSLKAVDDKDGQLALAGELKVGNGLYHPGAVVADPAHGRALLYQLSSNFKIFSLDFATGAKKLLIDGVSDIALAPDGSIYGTGKFGASQLLHFDADGKPAPFAGSDSNVVKMPPHWIGGVNLGARGMVVGPNGDIYVMRPSSEKGVQSRVDVFGPDGKLKKPAIVDGLGIGDCGIGVDAAGNIYLGANVKPKGRLYQPGFEDKIPPTSWLCWAQWNWGERPAPWYYSMRNEYLYHWGAAFKFGPAGGAFYGRGSLEYDGGAKRADVASVENAPASSMDCMSGYLVNPVKVAGAQWRYAGMGIVPSSERQWGDPSCVCMTSRLSADGFGRVYMPNCFRFCVEVLDANGNLISRIGRYGNPDDAGPEARFAWPAFVSVGGDTLCVSDSVNRRVSVLKLEYSSSESAAVP